MIPVGRQVTIALRSGLSVAHGNCPACSLGLLLLLPSLCQRLGQSRVSPRNRCHRQGAAHTVRHRRDGARNLADQREAQAHAPITTLTHTGRTVEGCKNTLAFLLWHARSTVGNAEASTGQVEGTTDASMGEPAA